MKINFYAIYSQNQRTKDKYKLDLLDLLNKKIIEPKSHALDCETHHLYLHRIDDKTFLFTKTSDSELIKKINRSNSSVKDIRDSLTEDESLGFPSFIFIDGNVMGFASSMYGPRTRELAEFVKNKNLIQHKHHYMVAEPLMRDMSKDDALKMDFIGRTTLRVETGNRICSEILKGLGCKKIEEELLDGLEIIIKPKRNKDIKGITKDIITNKNNSFSDVHIKAREEAADILTEYYLSGKGHLGANLYKASNADVAEEIQYCFIRMKTSIIKSFDQTLGDELKQT
ncbi:protein rexA [Photorhabdus cinerea]|uniref:Protein rexA n=1 Tax=Photorhabdus cinerea TaxID=471575 RepID=A0A7X5TJC7_9GAMM|nr:protein rexA [Photorhabdus cinerea]NHB94473.1 protein rexA [Photorhabdus cinerea]